MNNIARTSTKNGGKASLSVGWVETQADFLFNFAIGQLQDAGVVQD
jgi:hypothetical protein